MKVSIYYFAAPVVLALLSAVSCQKTFSGIEVEEKFKHEGTPERVTLLVGDYGRDYVDTKTAGAVTDRWSWAESIPELKVYAFRKNSPCLNEMASDKSSMCIIDGSLDSTGVKSGRTATFTAPEYVIKWPLSDKVLRYPSGSSSYQFYAYHTGNCDVPESDIDRSPSYISFPARIDGATDLMYGESVLTSNQREKIPFLGISPEDTTDFLKTCFSDYSASVGIIPVLKFQHALTRICFDLYPGERGCNDVIVERVSVKTRDSCIFTVASTDSLLHPMGVDFSIDEKDAVLNLLEENGSPLNDTLYHTDYKGDFTEEILSRSHVRIGGCFLLPPEKEYVFEFYTHKKGSDYSVRTEIGVCPIKTERFMAGSVYIVRIAIYDLIPILFDAGLGPDPWKDVKPIQN